MYFHSFPFRDASTKGKPSPSSFQSRTQSQGLENLHQTQFFPDTTCIWVGWADGELSFHLDFFLSSASNPIFSDTACTGTPLKS